MDADAMLKVLTRYLFVALVCSGCENTTEYIGVFSDGLPDPNKTEFFDLSDEYYGVEHIDTLYIDINNNQKADTIERGRFVTGTAHAYTFYKITLDDGTKLEELRTSEGADCVLQAYKFSFDPFTIVKATRPVSDNYAEPTKATIETFKISDNELKRIQKQKSRTICDVRYLL